VDAVFTVFVQEHTAHYQALRDAIAQRHASETTPEGRVAFVFSLVGRRAFAFATAEPLALQQGGECELEFVVSLESCLRREKLTGSTPLLVAVSSADMLSGLKPGVRVEFGYGEAELELLELLEASEDRVRCRARATGTSHIRSGMDVSSKAISKALLPLLPIDTQALQSHCMGMADLVVLHGVSSPNDIATVQELLERNHTETEDAISAPPILVRIDSQESLVLLPQISDKIHGVFLNRSELGTSVHPHSLPVVQKELLARCNLQGKTVLVSSDIFASMRHNPNPTRAEVSDLANLVADGVDAVVIGREVTEGPYASNASEYLRDAMASAESDLLHQGESSSADHLSDIDGLAHAALHTAEHIKAKAIVCITRQGYTAGRLSSMHAPIDVIAITQSLPVMRRMQLMHSVRPVFMKEKGPTDHIFSQAKSLLRDHFSFEKGERVVFVSLSAAGATDRSSNLIAVEEF
jgi:pyruvate kinase